MDVKTQTKSFLETTVLEAQRGKQLTRKQKKILIDERSENYKFIFQKQ